jgi:hypothetical protein
MRRTHLRGHTNILKRLCVPVGGFNLGLLMRTLLGVGTPRGLQGRLGAMIGMLVALIAGRWRDVVTPIVDRQPCRALHRRFELPSVSVSGVPLTTGC